MGDVPVHVGQRVVLADAALEDARRDEDHGGIDALKDLLQRGDVEGSALFLGGHHITLFSNAEGRMKSAEWKTEEANASVFCLSFCLLHSDFCLSKWRKGSGGRGATPALYTRVSDKRRSDHRERAAGTWNRPLTGGTARR